MQEQGNEPKELSGVEHRMLAEQSLISYRRMDNSSTTGPTDEISGIFFKTPVAHRPETIVLPAVPAEVVEGPD